MMGTEQESWLYHGLARDKSTWQLLGVGTNIGYNSTPTERCWRGSPPMRQKVTRTMSDRG